MQKIIFVSLIFSFLITGCTIGENEGDGYITKESIERDAEVFQSELGLRASLTNIALKEDNATFVEAALEHLVPELVGAYVPDAYVDEVLESEAFQISALADSEVVSSYLLNFYNEAISNAESISPMGVRASTVDDTLSEIIEVISEYLYNLIYNYFFGDEESEDDSSLLDDLIDVFTGDDSDDESSDTENENNSTSGNGDGDSDNGSSTGSGELVSEELGFNYAMLSNATFYVVSSKADMTVEMSSDGKSGSGSMGFISMDFSDTVDASTGFLNISTSLMGDWSIQMSYLDADHCIAADAISEDGDVYESYWFLDESVMEQARTVAQAKALCLQHGYVGGEAPSEEPNVDESNLVAIDDDRVGFDTKTGETTKAKVENYLASTSHTASVTDAKYFSRELRNGMLSIVHTNDKPDTVEGYETEIMSRDLMPFAGSALLQMQELAGDAMDASAAFKREVENDFNASVNGVTGRMQALATTMNQVMQAAMDSDDYAASGTTSYGDVVTMGAYNIDVDVCLVFFLCESNVEADVHVTVKNSGTKGNYADLHLFTHVYAESSGIYFSDVVNIGDASNRFAGNGYEMTIDEFNYNNPNKEVFVKGSGALSSTTNSAARLDSFDLFLELTNNMDGLRNANFSFDGKVSADSGRIFEGIIDFNGKDASSNKFDGHFDGIDNEPTIDGVLKATLTYRDIIDLTYGREPISVATGLPYFVLSNGSKALVQNFYRSGSSYKAKDFERNDYDCASKTDNTFTCKPWSSFNNSGTRTLKFTKAGEMIVIGTNKGDWYITDIENVSSFSNGEMHLLHTESGDTTTLDSFDFDKADVENVRVNFHDVNEELDLNNIGDHSYTADLRITRGDEVVDSYVQATRDTANDMWHYTITDLLLENNYGTVSADAIMIKDKGNLGFQEELTKVLTDNIVSDFEFSLDDMLALSYADFETLQKVSIDNMHMHLNSGGNGADIALNTTLEKLNANTVEGEGNLTYKNDGNTITLGGDISIAISGSGEDTSFTPTMNITATLNHALLEDSYTMYLQEVADTSYILLHNDQTQYEQAFRVQDTSVEAADSYSVKANMTIEEDWSLLNSVIVRDKDSNTLGEYDKVTDTQKIEYSDESSEYLYIH